MGIVVCPKCRTSLEVPAGVGSVICPYCEYQIVLMSPEKGAYMLPRRVDTATAHRIYLEELGKQFGVSEDTLNNAKNARIEIHMVPVAIFNSDSKIEIFTPYGKETVYFKREFPISLHPLYSWMDGIPLSAAGKVGLDIDLYKDAEFLEINPERLRRARNRARGYVRRILTERARKRSDSSSKNVYINVREEGIVYVPLYVLEYDGMKGVVEGVGGRVLYGEYVLSGSGRAGALLGTVFILGLAGAVGWFTGYFPWTLLPAIAGSVPLFMRGAGGRGTFGMVSSVEVKEEEGGDDLLLIDLALLMRKLSEKGILEKNDIREPLEQAFLLNLQLGGKHPAFPKMMGPVIIANIAQMEDTFITDEVSRLYSYFTTTGSKDVLSVMLYIAESSLPSKQGKQLQDSLIKVLSKYADGGMTEEDFLEKIAHENPEAFQKLKEYIPPDVCEKLRVKGLC